MEKRVEDLKTYSNRNGFPMIRRCQNCVFWNNESEFNPKHKVGYCTFKPLFFAFTLEPSVYPITKEFYLCGNHIFKNEDKLSQVSDIVNLKDIIKTKDELI
jgi:hypothetical protein